MGLAGRLWFPREVFNFYTIAKSALTEVTIQYPLGFIGSRRTSIRSERNTNNNSPAIKSGKPIAQANGRFHLPRVDGGLGKSGHEVRSCLESEGHDQVIIIDSLVAQSNLLTRRIDSQDFGLNDFDIAPLKKAEVPADVLRPAFPEHDEKKSGHENVLGAPVNENNIVIRA